MATIRACTRLYSTTVATKRPALADVLPSKRSLQKLLFDFDSKLNYRKYLPVISKIYDNLDNQDLIIEQLPRKVKGSDLMLFRKVLQEIRTKSHTINRHLVKLENELVEYGAEMGDNDAVAILAFECLKNPQINTEEDTLHAKELVKQLVELKHPLALKLSGDLAYEAQNFAQCESFYTKFLESEKDTMLAGEVYQSFGILCFRNLKDLNRAEAMFQKAIKLTTLDKLSHSYFHLGLIYEDDPKLARYYFEMAASQGLLESFANLGFMELNVFKNPSKAIEWFKLGTELGDFNCTIGIFDSLMADKDYKNAKRSYNSIVAALTKNPNLMSLERFHELRKNSIEELLSTYSPPVQNGADKWSL